MVTGSRIWLLWTLTVFQSFVHSLADVTVLYSDPKVVFSQWGAPNDQGGCLPGYRSTSVAGAFISYSFTGTRIKANYLLDLIGAPAQLIVDNKLVTTTNTGSNTSNTPDTCNLITGDSGPLSDGTHTVSVIMAQPKSDPSTQDVYFRGFVYSPSQGNTGASPPAHPPSEASSPSSNPPPSNPPQSNPTQSNPAVPASASSSPASASALSQSSLGAPSNGLTSAATKPSSTSPQPNNTASLPVSQMPSSQTSSVSGLPGDAGSQPPVQASSTSGRSNIGAIVGGVIGGICALLALMVLLWYIRRKRIEKALSDAPEPYMSDLPSSSSISSQIGAGKGNRDRSSQPVTRSVPAVPPPLAQPTAGQATRQTPDIQPGTSPSSSSDSEPNVELSPPPYRKRA